MSISTLESRASVQALDAMWADTEVLESAEHFYADELHGELNTGDLQKPTYLSALRERYTPGQADRVLRYETLREFVTSLLNDGLPTYGEPSAEDAIELVCRAARGEDIREEAQALMGRVATLYAKAKVGGSL
jgi:hypothetical protein